MNPTSWIIPLAKVALGHAIGAFSFADGPRCRCYSTEFLPNMPSVARPALTPL
jgi:hypothetical protein